MGLSEKNYEELLASFNDLQVSNDKKKKSGVHDYSLMNALLKKTEEVHLHSNFIYSMINANGSHYCGNIFLAKFLESIEKADFINIDNVRVHKEKGKIDLLIEDGNNFIIIENKLRAIDQKHQISRYIQYVKNEYLEEIDNVSDNICVVYLSEYNKKPKPKSDSVIGFEYEIEDDKPIGLIRDNNEIELFNGDILDLPTNTKLQFSRVKHSKELSQWVAESIKWLNDNKPNSQALIYAFNEYGLILKRLDTTKSWRNIMSLDEYVLKLQEDKQREMSNFMEEAYKKLNDYKSKKIFEFFEKYPQAICDIDGKVFKEFTPDNCQSWFKKIGGKDKYRDVGVEIEIKNEKYIFAMGINNIAFGRSADFDFSKNIVSNRAKDIFVIISEIEKKFNESPY